MFTNSQRASHLAHVHVQCNDCIMHMHCLLGKKYIVCVYGPLNVSLTSWNSLIMSGWFSILEGHE